MKSEKKYVSMFLNISKVKKKMEKYLFSQYQIMFVN